MRINFYPNGLCRIITNKEIYQIIKNKDVINYITYQVQSWFGKIRRNTSERKVKVSKFVSQLLRDQRQGKG